MDTHTPGANMDTDRVSFMDGQQAYVEFGDTGKAGSGYIRRTEIGWTMGWWDRGSYTEHDDFETFRQALDAFMQHTHDAQRWPEIPVLKPVADNGLKASIATCERIAREG